LLWIADISLLQQKVYDMTVTAHRRRALPVVFSVNGDANKSCI